MKFRFDKSRGSVAIEALISTSITILICMIMLGTLLSIYVDERLDWSLLQTREEMRLVAMPFMGHDRFIQRKVNETILGTITNHIVIKQFENYSINKLVKLHNTSSLTFDQFGFAEYHMKYQYSFPTIFRMKNKVIPITAGVITDGVNFKEAIVYITTYGEKFHKSDCFHLRKSKFAISIDLAKEKGYEACKNCHTDQPTDK